MTNLTKTDVKSGILDFCKTKGFKPGSLFVAKANLSIPMVFDDNKDFEFTLLTELKRMNTFVDEGEIFMFVDGHAVMNNGSWDFWYEFLFRGQTVFIHTFDFGNWTLTQFEKRTTKHE